MDLEKGKRHLESRAFVDWTLPVELRGGGAVRLYDAEAGGDQPVIGSYYTGQRWIPCAWALNGLFRPDNKPCKLDVVNGDSEKESV